MYTHTVYNSIPIIAKKKNTSAHKKKKEEQSGIENLKERERDEKEKIKNTDVPPPPPSLVKNKKKAIHSGREWVRCFGESCVWCFSVGASLHYDGRTEGYNDSECNFYLGCARFGLRSASGC